MVVASHAVVVAVVTLKQQTPTVAQAAQLAARMLRTSQIRDPHGVSAHMSQLTVWSVALALHLSNGRCHLCSASRKEEHTPQWLLPRLL
jgi:hypothetical protein